MRQRTDAERIAQLEEENAFLRRELGEMLEATSVEKLRRRLVIEPTQSRLLLRLALAKGRVVTHAQLMDLLPAGQTINTVRVHLHRLSKNLGLKVAAPAWRGYAITPSAAALVARTLGEREEQAA